MIDRDAWHAERTKIQEENQKNIKNKDDLVDRIN